MKRILLDGTSLTPDSLALLARSGASVGIAPTAKRRMTRCRKFLDAQIRRGERIYGVTTGFGPLATVSVSPKDARALQENLVRSHASGVGDVFSVEEARAIMTARVNVLAKGRSAVRPAVAAFLADCLNRGVVPIIPEQGSVGASGDLAPLSHMALLALGEGEAFYKGKRMKAADALRRAKLKAPGLAAKDGIALINGTQVMTAVGALALLRARNLLRHADLAAAMSVDALFGSRTPFDPRIHAERPHPGQRESASNIWKLLAGPDTIQKSHAGCAKVQDAYSLRCTPQVHGAARDACREAMNVVSRELNSATDNPLVFFEKGETLSGGNFHGQPVSQALDYATLGLTTLGNISDRRIYRLVTTHHSGLPAFLAKKPGLESGMMMAQVASAALASENKTLAHPASADSVPTEAGQEDHVSMGVWAARKLRMALRNATYIVAVEFMAASAALDLRKPLHPSRPLQAALAAVRRKVKPVGRDRVLSHDIEALALLIEEGKILRAAEAEAGRLV